jgi:Flp pilus assembly protein TadG
MEIMKNSHRGQTVIETALMILLLFVLFFGIAEVARFWWLKNQINNAARVGVRVAIVDQSLDSLGADLTDSLLAPCSWSGNCTASPAGSIQYVACQAITNQALCADGSGAATVYLSVQRVDADGIPGGSIVSPGGIITVTVRRPSVMTIVPGLASLSLGLIPSSIDLTSQSTMRHE